MKKKSARPIPDFSRHQTRHSGVEGTPHPSKVAPTPQAATPHPTVKPQSTSAKSGRRGQ